MSDKKTPKLSGIVNYTLGSNTSLVGGIANKFTVGASNSAFLGGQNSLAAGLTTSVLFGSSFSATLGGAAVSWTTAPTFTIASGAAVTMQDTSTTQAKSSISLKAGLDAFGQEEWKGTAAVLDSAKTLMKALLAVNALLGVTETAVISGTGQNAATIKAKADNEQLWESVGSVVATGALSATAIGLLNSKITTLIGMLQQIQHVGTLTLNGDGATLSASDDLARTLASAQLSGSTVTLTGSAAGKAGTATVTSTGVTLATPMAASLDLSNGNFTVTAPSQSQMSAGPAAQPTSVVVTPGQIKLSNPLNASIDMNKTELAINAPGQLSLGAGQSCTASFSSATGISLSNKGTTLGINPAGATVNGKLIRLG